ncbi:MAG: response regulator transcription factor [Phycisphaerales bacterium]|jgi:DNA-binding response OmpR family regulator
MRVLVVEDSARLREAVQTGLQRHGFAVDATGDGRQGLICARTTEYDVIVLDIMLPEMDGLELLTEARAKGVDAMVLLLTARDAVEDRVKGLQAGADDYLVKPFAFDELVARVQALARRKHGARSTTIRVDDLEIDATAKKVKRGGIDVDLKPREYAILEYLAHRINRPVSRDELEEHVYDEGSQVRSNAIDSAVCNLRARLNVASCRPLIHTRRGLGYVLSEQSP